MSTQIQRLKTRLLKLEFILTVILLLTPGILILISGEIRPSISNYAYSKTNHLFVFLLTIAATMLVYNGAAFNKHWYNIILGCLLAVVVLTPHLHYPIIHFIAAGLFFLFSVFVMIFYSSKTQRIYKVCAGVFIVTALFLHFFFNLYSLFIAEWIGIAPIALHYIGESFGKID